MGSPETDTEREQYDMTDFPGRDDFYPPHLLSLAISTADQTQDASKNSHATPTHELTTAERIAKLGSSGYLKVISD